MGAGAEAGPRSVAILGAAGYVGSLTLRRLAGDRRTIERIVAIDVREVDEAKRIDGVAYEVCDVRSKDLAGILAAHGVDAVVHLVAIVRPGALPPEVERSIDVDGARNVLEACGAAGVSHLVVTTSAAAYGFHADNPEWLREEHALRGHPAFAYAEHKRLVEALLAEWRERRPELRQLVLRPGTILGAGTRNAITDLFDKPWILGVEGSASPFIFIWDEDVAAVIVEGVHGRRDGIFNLAGDGSMTLRDVAAATGKPYLPLPAWLLRSALGALRRLGLTQYGPEQVDFLRYRSALANDRLKESFGYVPRLSTRRTFELFWRHRKGA